MSVKTKMEDWKIGILEYCTNGTMQTVSCLIIPFFQHSSIPMQLLTSRTTILTVEEKNYAS